MLRLLKQQFWSPFLCVFGILTGPKDIFFFRDKLVKLLFTIRMPWESYVSRQHHHGCLQSHPLFTCMIGRQLPAATFAWDNWWCKRYYALLLSFLRSYWTCFFLPGTSKLSVSDNLKLLSWLPQNDILGHPKTRLFIGHAGLNGILESTYHAVPMICSPFFGDQFDNAHMAKRAGFGEVVDLQATSSDEFASLIRKVITNPRWALLRNNHFTVRARG